MNAIDHLLRSAPRLDDPAPPVAGQTVSVTERDEEADTGGVPRRRYILEPFFGMIEYVDAGGARTRRRVTMQNVEERGGVRYLWAWCHERHQVRMFRLDRISCLISQDGEVEDAAPWFEEILAISEIEDLDPLTPRETVARESAVSPYTALRREITPAMILLIAAARSDDFLHPREIDRILRYVEDEAFGLRDSGTISAAPDAGGFDKIERTLRRLRPTRDDVLGALNGMDSWPLARKRRLAHALALTIAADGIIDAVEAGLFADLCSFGARQHGHGWQD